MKIWVKFIGFSQLPPGFEEHKEIQAEFFGHSLEDLIYRLFPENEAARRWIFLPGGDEISSDLYTVVNGIMIPSSHRFNFRLSEGDRVHLILSGG